MRLVTAADCGRQLRANAQQNVAEQAERGMLHISHDFTQNTQGKRALLPYIMMLVCLAAKPCVSKMQLQSYLETHRCANRSTRVCRDECLHMCSELNAALWLLPSRVWCDKLNTVHSAVQKCSSMQTQRMGLTAMRGRRALWWPWIFLCGFCDSAPPNGGSVNYTSRMISIFSVVEK